MRPSLLLIGVPNGSTSIVAKLYHELGWHYEADHEGVGKFMENAWLGSVAKQLRSPDRVHEGRVALQARLDELPRPFVLKDHRLSWTLSKVQGVFKAIGCRLVLVKKPLFLTEQSTQRRRGRHNNGWWRRSPEQWWQAALKSYGNWAGDKHIVRTEMLRFAAKAQSVPAFRVALGIKDIPLDAVGRAMSCFDPTRDEPDSSSHGKNGWVK